MAIKQIKSSESNKLNNVFYYNNFLKYWCIYKHGTCFLGIVKDVTQNFDAPFHVSGAMLLLGGFLCCLLHLPYFQNNMNSNISDPDGNSLAAYDANNTAKNTKINGIMPENSDDGEANIV